MDKTTFRSVQRLLDDAKQLHRKKMKTATHRVFLLSGVIRCGECGRALIGQSAHGKNQVHRYYSHSINRSLEPIKCSVKRYNADEVEKVLLNHLTSDALDAGYLDDVKIAIKKNGQCSSSEIKKEMGRLEKAVKSVDVEIENVFKLQSGEHLSESVKEVISERLEKLSSQRKVHQNYLNELRQSQDELLETDQIAATIESKIHGLNKAIKKAEPTSLKRLIRSMYDVIILKEGRLEGYYITTNQNGGDRQDPKTKKASGDHPEAFNRATRRQPSSGWHPSVQGVAYWTEWWRSSHSHTCAYDSRNRP